MKLVTVALLLSCAVVFAAAWGPTSHYYYTCTAHDIPLSACFDDKNHHLLSGTEMPDAFFFGMLVQPGNDCVGLAMLHSTIFGGYLFQEAPKFNTPTFNATEFALGFGMHTAADMGGFGSGYLASPTEPTQWLNTWPFMTSIDGYIANEIFAPVVHRKVPTGIPEVNDEMAAFVAHTTSVMSNVSNGESPVADAAQVTKCASQWQPSIGVQTHRAEGMPRAAYEYEMTLADRFGAKNFTVAKAHWEMAKECSINGAALWGRLIISGVSPTAANTKTIAYLESAVMSGKCSPL